MRATFQRSYCASVQCVKDESLLQVILERFARGVDEERDHGEVLLDLRPLGGQLLFRLIADRLQKVRQSGEAAAVVAVARTRRKDDVTAKNRAACTRTKDVRGMRHLTCNPGDRAVRAGR